jgi:hypothetical protein
MPRVVGLQSNVGRDAADAAGFLPDCSLLSAATDHVMTPDDPAEMTARYSEMLRRRLRVEHSLERI